MGCVLTLLDKETLAWSERARVPLINLSMPQRNMAGGKIKREKKGKNTNGYGFREWVREVGWGGNHP